MGSCSGCSRGVICVLGGILIHLSYGYFYTVGNMAPYIIDYMNHKNIPVQHTSSVWLTSFAISFEAVGMPVGGMLAKFLGSRTVIGISCILHSGSIALTYLTMQWHFVAVVLSYGVLQGFGFGFGYAVIIAVSAMWFPSRRGLIVGLTVGGFGAGALIFTPIQTAYINPHNIPVNPTTKVFDDPDLLSRVPTACLVLSVILILIQSVGVLLMKERFEDRLQSINEFEETPQTAQPRVIEQVESEETDSSEEDEEEIFSNQKELVTLATQENRKAQKVNRKKTRVNLDSQTVVNLPPSEAIQYADFYILWFASLFASIPITTIASLYKLVGIEHINDDRFLAGVSMMASACNAGGRVFWGYICDRFSFKAPMSLMLVLWTALLFSFPHVTAHAGSLTKGIYFLWVALLYFCFCGVFIFAPTATETLFGPENLAVNYGLVYNSFIVGSFMASLLNSIPPLSGKPSYAFGIGSLMSTCALLTIFWITDRKLPPYCLCLGQSTRLRKRCNRRARKASQKLMRRISQNSRKTKASG